MLQIDNISTLGKCKHLYLMFKKQLQKVIEAAGSIYALWVLGVVSFLESALLPIPVDAFSIPVMLANRTRLWQAAIVASLASVAGGCVGYFIGMALSDSVGAWIISSYGLETQFEAFKTDVGERGGRVIAIAAITPVPYKIVAIAAGVVGYGFFAFFVISAICRSLRFFAFALAIYYLGPNFQQWMKDRATLVTSILIIVTIAGFLSLFYFT